MIKKQIQNLLLVIEVNIVIEHNILTEQIYTVLKNTSIRILPFINSSFVDWLHRSITYNHLVPGTLTRNKTRCFKNFT